MFRRRGRCFLQVMTISPKTKQGLFVSHRGHFEAQVMVCSRRRVIAVLQTPRIAGLVEAEGRGGSFREDAIPDSRWRLSFENFKWGAWATCEQLAGCSHVVSQ